MERGRGRSRLLAGSPMWDSIPGPGIMPWAEGRRSTAEPPGVPAPLLSLGFCSDRITLSVKPSLTTFFFFFKILFIHS